MNAIAQWIGYLVIIILSGIGLFYGAAWYAYAMYHLGRYLGEMT